MHFHDIQPKSQHRGHIKFCVLTKNVEWAATTSPPNLIYDEGFYSYKGGGGIKLITWI